MTTHLDLFIARYDAQARYREFVGRAVLGDHFFGRVRPHRMVLLSAARMFRGCLAHREYLAALAALRRLAVAS